MDEADFFTGAGADEADLFGRDAEEQDEESSEWEEESDDGEDLPRARHASAGPGAPTVAGASERGTVPAPIPPLLPPVEMLFGGQAAPAPKTAPTGRVLDEEYDMDDELGDEQDLFEDPADAFRMLDDAGLYPEDVAQRLLSRAGAARSSGPSVVSRALCTPLPPRCARGHSILWARLR